MEFILAALFGWWVDGALKNKELADAQRKAAIRELNPPPPPPEPKPPTPKTRAQLVKEAEDMLNQELTWAAKIRDPVVRDSAQMAAEIRFGKRLEEAAEVRDVVSDRPDGFWQKLFG
jgi:hypothetical protein